MSGQLLLEQARGRWAALSVAFSMLFSAGYHGGVGRQRGDSDGVFGTYVYDGARWLEHLPDQHPDLEEPWLRVDVHDSDIATIVYRPTGPGTGVAYLGHTPRTYYEDAGASAPTDTAREAAGLTAWWDQVHGGVGEADREAKESQLVAYLAEDIDPAEIEVHEDEDVDELDDERDLRGGQSRPFPRRTGLARPR